MRESECAAMQLIVGKRAGISASGGIRQQCRNDVAGGLRISGKPAFAQVVTVRDAASGTRVLSAAQPIDRLSQMIFARTVMSLVHEIVNGRAERSSRRRCLARTVPGSADA